MLSVSSAPSGPLRNTKASRMRISRRSTMSRMAARVNRRRVSRRGTRRRTSRSFPCLPCRSSESLLGSLPTRKHRRRAWESARQHRGLVQIDLGDDNNDSTSTPTNDTALPCRAGCDIGRGGDWFGPRGLASIVFGVVIIEAVGLPHTSTLVAIITVTVALSVFAHGISAAPPARRYTSWHAVTPSPMERAPGHQRRWRHGLRRRAF